MPTRSSSPNTPVFGDRNGARDGGVGELDVESARDRLRQRDVDPHRAEPVRDEAGRVAAEHDRLAEPLVGARDHAGQRVLVPDHLEQAQVAGRVEEVGDPVAAASSRERDGRRVRREHGARRRGPHAGVDVVLRRAVLDHGLDHPVAALQQRDVVHRPRSHAPGVGRHHERRRPRLREPLQRGSRPVRHDVEQHHSSPALAACAAMPAPIVPAPITPTRRTSGHSTASSRVAMPWPPPMHCVATA